MNFLRGHRPGYDAWTEAGAEGWGYDDLLPYFKRSENLTGIAGRDPEVRDLASGLEEGFGWGDLNIVDGKRQDAAAAYLRPVLDRPNLHGVTDALVHRVLLDGDHCTGVEYGVDGGTVIARCAGEVVLSAGAVGTPQLSTTTYSTRARSPDGKGSSTRVRVPTISSDVRATSTVLASHVTIRSIAS
ncbi:GMC family oxidoreductase N-terminal domain-containing protein [Streptomyces mirabilis]